LPVFVFFKGTVKAMKVRKKKQRGKLPIHTEGGGGTETDILKSLNKKHSG